MPECAGRVNRRRAPANRRSGADLYPLDPAPSRSALADARQVGRSEEESDFVPGVFGRVGGVDRVPLLALDVQRTDGAGSRFGGVRCTDDLAQGGHRVIPLEDEGDARAGGHEADERVEEGALPVDRIEGARLCGGELEHADAPDTESLALE